MSTNDQLWRGVLAEIEILISPANLNMWFKNTSIQKQENGVVYLTVPNSFVKDWLLNKYHKVILRTLRKNIPSTRGVEYIVSKNQKERRQENIFSKEILTDQQTLDGLDASREDGLNPRYTFESFVVGPFNELVYAAAQAVVKNPGSNYNPLFIYGGTGLGKTHLLQAIGNQIKKQNNNKRVFYVTTERFTLDYIDALQNNKALLYKEKYRKYDVLIMDDVQFVSGKEKTQEELFHLFNSLYENNKQIIFSSDKPPRVIEQLEDRLRSRFEGGMMIDVSKPDYESRLAILKNKTEREAFQLSEEVLEFIASTIQDNIRELEGVLKLIVCQCQLKKRVISVPEVRQLVKNNLRPQKTISIKDVIRTVAEFYSIDERLLFEKSRRKEVVKPRQIAMYILREDLNTSYPYIGQKLGGRDHTTVIHACEKIKKDISLNQLLNQEIEQIKGLLYKDSYQYINNM